MVTQETIRLWVVGGGWEIGAMERRVQKGDHEEEVNWGPLSLVMGAMQVPWHVGYLQYGEEGCCAVGTSGWPLNDFGMAYDCDYVG